MKIMRVENASFVPAFGIDMAPIDALRTGRNLAGGFGRVGPHRETLPHQHDETEAFVMLSGRGEVVVNNVAHPIESGVVAVFEPFETHILRNTGEEEILFVDLYWRDPQRTAPATKNSERGRLSDRPMFVFSTPPTPNGDLHVGHLSGPYLGADVFVRFQRMNGVEAYHLTGSDDYQSYVVRRARQEGRTPVEIANHYATEIRTTLELMDIPLDQYTITSESPAYSDGLRRFFSRIVAAGICPREGGALFDGSSGDYLYEADVDGRCPRCGSASGGNICEECGEPNACLDLIGPRSKLSRSTPRQATIERYSVPVHEFHEVVLDHHRRGKVSPRLQHLAARVFARNVFHLPITHPASWGVRPAQQGGGEQVIWVWPEMAYGFLHGIAELGRRLGKDWAADRPQPDWKIIHFFGYDNSFYHTILFPILYKLAYPNWQPDIEYNVNEFYLLDGQKFSTSRRHAIWGKQILSPATVDAVRYYLALTRGETRRADFNFDAFRQAVETTLIGKWQSWLDELGDLIKGEFDCLAPDAGSWTPVQVAFLARLHTRLAAVTGHYGANGFSLNGAMSELNGLVDDAIGFAASHRGLAAIPGLRDEFRTAIALELAASRLLASCAFPVMPRFAQRLADALGGIALSEWPDCVSLVPSGTEITLSDARFFELPAAPSSPDRLERDSPLASASRVSRAEEADISAI
jgi:methionyl-tRNA synthetase